MRDKTLLVTSIRRTESVKASICRFRKVFQSTGLAPGRRHARSTAIPRSRLTKTLDPAGSSVVFLNNVR